MKETLKRNSRTLKQTVSISDKGLCFWKHNPCRTINHNKDMFCKAGKLVGTCVFTPQGRYDVRRFHLPEKPGSVWRMGTINHGRHSYATFINTLPLLTSCASQTNLHRRVQAALIVEKVRQVVVDVWHLERLFIRKLLQ